ncbi:winged helix-turn-helix transcriptional regulator [Desertivirga arenae]|uniref:winged helix-turn-helix transcriptional regulator n=1 Tax=Desertivirga arenae TaxID=2810309 RepID=UPI001A95CD23|nr:helix-turn-helix domain-containing protein [Pedobacter sp. SYSU D00823]
MTKIKERSTNKANREKLYDFCAAMYALDILAGRWKLYILYKLEHGSLRFNELKQLIPDITERMLTVQLKEMERDGLIIRKVYAEVPPRVEYQLTDSSVNLMPFWAQLEKWGNAHRVLQGKLPVECPADQAGVLASPDTSAG